MTPVDLLANIQLLNGLAEKLLGRFDDEQLWLTTNTEPALAIHAETRILRGHATDIGKETDRLLIATLGGARHATVNGKVIEVRRSYRRTWDTPLLAGAVAARVLQGERLEQVDHVIAAFVQTARLEWRVTELEKLGINADDYCDKELGQATVSVI